MKNTLKTLSRTLTLLACAALPFVATAQGRPPRTKPEDAPTEGWLQKVEKRRAEDEQERLLREAEDKEVAQRKLKVREASKEDLQALDGSRQLLARLFQLPATLALSADNRALAESTLQPQRERAAAAWPAWQTQALTSAVAASGKRAAQNEQANLLLSVRALNEAALWFADAEPHPSDSVWIEALRRGGLCQGLTATEPAAQMAALIEALPPEQRAAAWAGEAARLARWGQEQRTVLPAPERAFEDSLVPALTPPALARTLGSMPPALRAAVQAPGWTLAAQEPAQRCELLRWWSQEQVRLKQLSPRQAMLAWRTALAPRSADFLLAGQPRSGAQALDKAGFPVVAHRLALVGQVFVEQDIDVTGKVLHAFVQRRELRSASLGTQVPVGLEHELDQATLDRVAAMAPQAPNPGALRDGVATRRLGVEWAMD
jgi:hypothetical protein